MNVAVNARAAWQVPRYVSMQQFWMTPIFHRNRVMNSRKSRQRQTSSHLLTACLLFSLCDMSVRTTESKYVQRVERCNTSQTWRLCAYTLCSIELHIIQPPPRCPIHGALWRFHSTGPQSSSSPAPPALSQVETLEAGSGQRIPRRYPGQIRGWAAETRCALWCWLQWAWTPAGKHTCCTAACSRFVGHLSLSRGMQPVTCAFSFR